MWSTTRAVPVPGLLLQKGTVVTCTTCGASVDSHATTCSVCDAPVPATSAVAAGATDAPAAPVGTTVASTAGSSDQDGSDGSPTGGPGQGGHQPPPAGEPGSGAYPPPGGTGSGGYPPPGGQQWGGQPLHPSGLPSEVRSWGIGAHLAGLGAALFSAAIFGFVGPLFVWLLKRDEDPFIDHHAKEALNFQLTVLVAIMVGALMLIPAVIVGVLTLGVGLVLLAGVVMAAIVGWFVLPIIGAVRAADGKGYRYPLTIRFLR